MSSFTDEEYIQRVFVAKDEVKPEILGRGPAAIRGSAYMQGPNLFGSDITFPGIWATTMVGPLNNSDSIIPFIPGGLQYCGSLTNHSPYSFAVTGDAAIFNNLDVNLSIIAGGEIKSSRNIKAQGSVESNCGKHKLHKKKNFDIPHPTKEGWRLTHTCIEGPEAAVYIRGRLKNKSEIELPEYWQNLIDVNSITVSLTPIGEPQNIFVKDWNIEKIYLQSDKEIDCFYHVYAERIDTEKLIPEYKGTIEDYPGDNSQRSIVGYHYNNKE
jgi:hypothetical protein